MKMKYLKILCATAIISIFSLNVYADEVKISILSTKNNQSMGVIVAADTPQGLLLKPDLSGLTEGLHGVHIHENPACGNHGDDAGPHWDPMSTKTHLGPYDSGHLGDLPAIYADKAGNAVLPVLAPHLTVSMLRGHSIIIHAGGDNYSDEPPLGGGGARIGCGVISP